MVSYLHSYIIYDGCTKIYDGCTKTYSVSYDPVLDSALNPVLASLQLDPIRHQPLLTRLRHLTIRLKQVPLRMERRSL